MSEKSDYNILQNQSSGNRNDKRCEEYCLVFETKPNSEYPVKCARNQSSGGAKWSKNGLGQEVIGGRSYGSDLSTAWLNMLEGSGGKTKVYQ